jgi:hypothetical protein
LCQKCTLICLGLKTCLKFSLYLVLDEFELFFAFSLVCCFLCHLLVLRFFRLLDDLLELFIAFGLLAVFYVSWI